MKAQHFAVVLAIGGVLVATAAIDELPVEAQGSAPAVSNVSGSLAHGTAMTVGGLRFGTKAVAAPVKYDDFQSLTTGQQVAQSAAPGPVWRNNGGTGQQYNPVASTARLRPGTPFARNMQSRWQQPQGGGSAASNVALTGQSFSKFYIDAWMYNDSTGVNSPPQNVKHFRLHQLGAGSPNAYLSNGGPASGGINIACARDGVPYTDSAFFQNVGAALMYNRWVHFQFMIDAGTGGSSNGACVVYLNGRLEYDHRNVMTLPSGYNSWPEIYVGNYVRTGDWTGDMYAYWESIYIDRTWARVEIGDNATYANCTHREVQIPTAWSDTSITVTANRGSFPSLSNLYLFVVDQNGIASPGFRLGTGSSTPRAPTGLRVIP